MHKGLEGTKDTKGMNMNRILYADDCLNVLNDSKELPDESIDLIYLDPPFSSNSKYNLPFKGKDKSYKPAEAFTDVWKWSDEDKETLDDLHRDPRTRSLATIVKFAQEVEPVGKGRRRKGSSLAAYLLNMILRLRAMRRVLKPTGSIYLHCDPTASHYLKLVMDGVFARKNFRNEIVWCYRGAGYPKKDFGKKHDILLRYTQSKDYTFNLDEVRMPYAEATVKRFKHSIGNVRGGVDYGKQTLNTKGRHPDDWWQIQPVAPSAKERLGYPTQKPLALLDRIIRASSNPGDTVFDPFCGCGTSVHAAESLGRKWIGIDISKFATGLVRDRILYNFKQLNVDDITMRGIPETIAEARHLAATAPFEFEKWVCGYIGAEGMFREPGEKGADGGVDGVLKFYPVREGQKVKPEYAIVQVKGGKVSPDAVKALHETVRRYEATAGVMVCFKDQLGTVENQRTTSTFRDSWGSYPVIQGYSVEALLDENQSLDLPLYGYKRKGALLSL